MATEKKNRTQREEDKESIASVENGNNSDTSASLHARRAKLRGALGGKAAGMNDPFATPSSFQSPDPFAGQSDPFVDGQNQNVNQASSFSQASGYSDPAEKFENSSDPFAGEEFVEETEVPVNVYGVPLAAEPEESTAPEEAPPVIPEPKRSRRTTSSSANSSSPFELAPAMPGTPAIVPPSVASMPLSQMPLTPLPQISDQTIELVNSIDQSLTVCATNLAALQNLAGEQNEVLKGLSQTLQNQTLLEIGLNLNSLTESLTAALEPMKAIGELVPALDSLVSTLEGKEQEQQPDKMSPDQLITNLADQLSAGLIDPWTFKCAYMAVYPTDGPADLLHRLVELLGSQRLSGDLFRSAYEAVQSAEGPLRVLSGGGAASGIADEAIRAQLDNLEKANKDIQKRQEEREQELMHLLSQRENELQSAQEQLNQRLEELNTRYAEAADTIASREEEFRAALESKDMDIIEKDAELNMLRAQMEELRVSTEEMGKELQREMAELKAHQAHQASHQNVAPAQAEAAAPPQQAVNSQGFFDSLPPANRAPGLFDTAPAQEGFAGDFGGDSGGGSFAAAPAPTPMQNPQTFQAPQNPQNSSFAAPAVPTFQAPNTPTFQAPQQAMPAPQPQPTQPAPQATPRPTLPNATPYSGGQSGSYGMGVRQQVFEVIVRQALAGAPWREICDGPMKVNNISPEEVETEVKRRQSLLNK